MNRCEKHGYGYAKYCWFCYNEWKKHKPYKPNLIDEFLKEYPEGKIP